MSEANNIMPFIMTFLPALVYSVIVFIYAPKGSIRVGFAFLYFLFGMLSIVFVDVFHFVIPLYHVPPAAWDATFAFLMLAITRIGIIEEGAKLTTVLIIDGYRKKRLDGYPTIMFYSMSIACGFAVLENIGYFQLYGEQALITRAVTSILLHMTCGLIMGYFLASARLSKIGVKKIIMYACVLVIPSLYHGIYDFIAMVNTALIMPMIGVCLISAWLMIKFTWRD